LEEEFEFEDRPYLLVGRSMMCDIRLNHSDVSYRHTYFQAWGGELFFIDLASRTGTFRDSIARHSGFFHPGSQLSIGPYSISQCEFPSDEQKKSITTREAIKRLPKANFEITKSLSTSGKKKIRSIRRPVTLIGNNPSCKIRLEDDSVSRVHCSLVLTDKGLWVVDLLGKDGIKVNGERTPFALLEQGDELEVGKFQLVRQDGGGETLEKNYDSDEAEVTEKRRRPARLEPQKQPKTLKRRSHKNHKNLEPSHKNSDSSSENFVQLSVPPSPQQLNLSETFVLTLVEQFASMQHQILNQSNQQMMMMSQLFSTMHQSHQELIRDDLHRVHEISMELERLQQEMLKEKSLTLLTESRRIEKNDVGGALPTSPEPRTNSGTDPTSGTDSTGDRVVKETNDGEEDLRVPHDRSESVIPKKVSEVEPNSAEQTDSKDTELAETKRKEEDPKSLRQRRKEKMSGGIHSHAWLTQRMSELEKEKTSHWKKIMNVLSRK